MCRKPRFPHYMDSIDKYYFTEYLLKNLDNLKKFII